MRTSSAKIPFDFRKWISRLVALLTILPPSESKWTSFPAFVSVETASKRSLHGSHLELDLAPVLLA
eukprot:14000570-Alexandrium_andersonii.AAC.1